MHWPGTLLCAALLLGFGVLLLAQAGPSEEAHRLARSWLVGAQSGYSFDAVAAEKRGKVIGVLKSYNQNQAQVAEAVDRIVTPGMYAKLPALLVRYEDVLVRHLTTRELRSVVRDEDNEARRSAAAKMRQVEADLEQARRVWGRDSCREIFAENRVVLAGLGLGEAVAGC